MPTIKVFGIPASKCCALAGGTVVVPADDPMAMENWRKLLLELIKNIQVIVTAILQLPPDQVTVFFPADLVQEGLGEELVTEVCGLFDLPSRTNKVKKELIEAIVLTLGNFVNGHLTQCQKVECYIASTVTPEACSMLEIQRDG